MMSSVQYNVGLFHACFITLTFVLLSPGAESSEAEDEEERREDYYWGQYTHHTCPYQPQIDQFPIHICQDRQNETERGQTDKLMT